MANDDGMIDRMYAAWWSMCTLQKWYGNGDIMLYQW